MVWGRDRDQGADAVIEAKLSMLQPFLTLFFGGADSLYSTMPRHGSGALRAERHNALRGIQRRDF
jgi:hypothetical protein